MCRTPSYCRRRGRKFKSRSGSPGTRMKNRREAFFVLSSSALHMKFLIHLSIVLAMHSAFAADTAKPSDASFRNEVQHAVEKGLDYLKTAQNSNGWWSTPDHPSVTALALSAFSGEPQ